MGSRVRKPRKRLQKIMNCLCSGEIVKEQEDTMVPSSSESLATKDFFSATASGFSGQDGQVERRLDSGNIEQAELSLRESGILNYEVGFFFSLIIYYLI
jgi:predicted regulator of Ras-like GTPase activity (Roadblock/LC7/MglB family)